MDAGLPVEAGGAARRVSFAALATISKMRLGSAAEKLIALAYADRHNEETGCAYPSIAWLCEFSSLNRKTVVAAVGRLEACGLLSDSGERRGDTKQIKVYRLNLNSAENGTVPKSEQYRSRNSTEKVVEQSQKRDTDTVRTRSSTKASPSPKKSAAAPPFVPPSDIPEAEWDGFEEMRKRIGKPMTAKARDLAIARLRLLAEDGHPPGDVLNHSILNNYQGLFPPKDQRHGQPAQRRMDEQPGLRGSRPDPSLDLLRAARRAEEEERAGSGGADHRGAWPALPTVGAG